MNWECPKCDAWLVGPENRMHLCPGLGGLASYFVLVGTKAKIETVEREDYIGDELVRLDNAGRPVMAIVTTRDDGEDRVVFAPTATASLRRD